MDKKMLTFEEAMARLETVVQKLEDGQLPLEKALELYEEGISLSRLCYEQLDRAEKQIVLLRNEKGILKEIPFQPPGE